VRTALFAISLALAQLVVEAASVTSATSYPATGSYAVVVSEATYAAPEWRGVVQALRRKHEGACVVYSARVDEAREALAKRRPRYACFVARPEEANREFVVTVHRLTRQLDSDPDGDVIWGILTGYDAGDALRIARRTEPLVIRKGLGGTGSLNLGLFEAGIKFDEGTKGGRWVKPKGGEERKEDWPDDSTQGLVEGFNDFRPDLFMTSGLTTTRDWQLARPPGRRVPPEPPHRYQCHEVRGRRESPRDRQLRLAAVERRVQGRRGSDRVIPGR